MQRTVSPISRRAKLGVSFRSSSEGFNPFRQRAGQRRSNYCRNCPLRSLFSSKTQQCSWYNHLDPAIKRGPWEEEEDRKIITLQHHLGNKWADIAMQIPGR